MSKPKGEASQRKYVAVLALIAAGILGLGTILKPERRPAQVMISEAEKVRLQRLTREKSLQDTTAYFAGVARGAATHLVWLDGFGESGVVWSDQGLIVAGRPEKRLPLTLNALGYGGDTSIAADPLVSAPDLSMTVLQARQHAGLQPAGRSSNPVLDAGAWVVYVSLREGGAHVFTPGIYSGEVTSACEDFSYREVETNLPLRPSMLGGGLFDTDGDLLAVILACGQRCVAVASKSIQDAIDQANGFAGRLLFRYGMRVSALEEQTAAVLGAGEGALVTEIRAGGIADMAGLKPGDVITGLEGEAVRNPQDLQKLALPAIYPSLELKLLRGRRESKMALPTSREASDASKRLFTAGIFLEPPVGGYLVKAVEAGSPADAAGVRAGDRLLEAGGSALNNLESARLILSSAGRGPTFLVIERGTRRLGLVLK